MSDWNTHCKRIKIALRLERGEIVEICRLGGRKISLSKADGWMRSPSDARRFQRMSAEEFEAFTSGLVEWARDNMRAE